MMSLLRNFIFFNCISSLTHPQIIPPYDKVCASKSTHAFVDGMYSDPVWQPELNGSIYYNERNSQYLFPHIESGRYRYLMISVNPTFVTMEHISCYCSIEDKPNNYIFSVDDCFSNWICLSHGRDGEQIQNTNMSVVNCNDIRVTGSDTFWLNGIYVWKMFVNMYNYSVYYCKECDGYNALDIDGSYLFGYIFGGGAYEWQIRGKYPDSAYPASSGWARCIIGHKLGPGYLFNLENCSNWQTYNATTRIWSNDTDLVVQKRVPCDSNVPEHCLYVDMYPSTKLATSNLVTVQGVGDKLSTYFYIFFIARNADCIYPKIKFEWQPVDYDGKDEYIRVINDNGSLIRTCGNASRGCGQFQTCIDHGSIGVDKIAMNKTYQILIVESPHVDALCPTEHNYSINARLTLTCAVATTTYAPNITSTTITITTEDVITSNPKESIKWSNVLGVVLGIASVILIFGVITIIIVFRRRRNERYVNVQQGPEHEDLPAEPAIPAENEVRNNEIQPMVSRDMNQANVTETIYIE